jgi:hypothetical protein
MLMSMEDTNFIWEVPVGVAEAEGCFVNEEELGLFDFWFH